MKHHIPIKRSQAFLIEHVPLFIKNSKGEYVLYKSENIKLDRALYTDKTLPDLFICKDDREIAVAEIQEALNIELYHQIRSQGLYKIKAVLNEIVKEAFLNPLDGGLDRLPETIEIMFEGYFTEPRFLKTLAEITRDNYCIAEHSVNVMVFALNYCIYAGFSEDDIKRLSTGALLHDIGKTQIPDPLACADYPLSDEEFDVYKTHTSLGYDLLKQSGKFDASTARSALEHHERIDGSGYPRGISNVSREGQLIGIIDDFEFLTFREKSYRKAQKPFDAMSKLKNELLQKGKFSRTIFADFCRSLG